jgi:hypothetical protein
MVIGISFSEFRYNNTMTPENNNRRLAVRSEPMPEMHVLISRVRSGIDQRNGRRDHQHQRLLVDKEHKE